MKNDNPQYDRGSCYFCHEPDTHILETHHIVPRRFDGTDDAENLVTVCPTCHQRLERLYDERFFESLGVEPAGDSTDGGEGETSREQRERIETMRRIINRLESEHPEGAPIDTVLNEAQADGIERPKAESEMENLRCQGDVYEPTTDYLRTV
jgi:DNA replicative helicase MCM subunit Mcm2 (Cdc46/Mcm family)